ncbi:hypothetical protein D9M72_541170 [compost metagenome]
MLPLSVLVQIHEPPLATGPGQDSSNAAAGSVREVVHGVGIVEVVCRATGEIIQIYIEAIGDAAKGVLAL